MAALGAGASGCPTSIWITWPPADSIRAAAAITSITMNGGTSLRADAVSRRLARSLGVVSCIGDLLSDRGPRFQNNRPAATPTMANDSTRGHDPSARRSGQHLSEHAAMLVVRQGWLAVSAGGTPESKWYYDKVTPACMIQRRARLPKRPSNPLISLHILSPDRNLLCGGEAGMTTGLMP